MSYTRSAASLAASTHQSLIIPKANPYVLTTDTSFLYNGLVHLDYCTLLPHILIISTPVAIGPTGPAMFGGGGGGHSGPTCPFNEKAQTASPLALPCS